MNSDGNSWCIRNARVLLPGEGVIDSSVHIERGRIAAVTPDLHCPPGCPVVDADGALLTPGLVDVHTHGIRHFRYEAGSEETVAAAACLARYGCTTAFPTLLGSADAGFLRLLADVCAALPGVDTACLPGVHVEGPFLAYTGAGCTLVDADPALLEDILAAGGGRVAAMSISPEVAGIVPVIERLVAAGVRVFITHTGADVGQTQRAIAAGARHATHFYDVFYPPPETDLGVRPVGCVETVLADRRVSLDFIADGVHVDPVAVRLGVYAKGWPHVVLVTDSNVGAGLPPGEYDTPWGFRVRAHPERAVRILAPHRLAGALAGSSLTMDRGIANLLRWFGGELDPACIWAMGTANPARLMGLEHKGRVDTGADADLVLWDAATGTPSRTWVGGRLVYAHAEDALPAEAVERAPGGCVR